ncbi:MAG: hypothetical protein ACYYKD_09865 [Rhodospirillales bacterium]
MATDSDIYRAADLLIREYGEMAAIGAMAKADHLSSQGDSAGEALWRRIVTAIESLQTDDCPPGVTIN